HLGGEDRVRPEREVRAVLLEGAGGQQHHGILRRYPLPVLHPRHLRHEGSPAHRSPPDRLVSLAWCRRPYCTAGPRRCQADVSVTPAPSTCLPRASMLTLPACPPRVGCHRTS